MSDHDEYEAYLYSAYETEGWDTEALLQEWADPGEVRIAKAYAERESLPWPPVARERDFIGQWIAVAFDL